MISPAYALYNSVESPILCSLQFSWLAHRPIPSLYILCILIVYTVRVAADFCQFLAECKKRVSYTYTNRACVDRLIHVFCALGKNNYTIAAGGPWWHIDLLILNCFRNNQLSRRLLSASSDDDGLNDAGEQIFVSIYHREKRTCPKYSFRLPTQFALDGN